VKWITGILIGLAAVILIGCAPQTSALPALRVTGAYDVIPIAAEYQKNTAWSKEVGLIVQPSTSSLVDVKTGKADLAIVGYDPGISDMQGLTDTVIGYDAVCLLINTRSYIGGLNQSDNSASGGLIVPIEKAEPLQDMPLEEVRHFEANKLKLTQNEWISSRPFFSYQPYFNDDGSPTLDLEQPKMQAGTWIWGQISYGGLSYIPGKFDTQAVVLQKLEIPTCCLNNASVSVAPRFYNSEEELISSRFRLLTPEMQKTVSNIPFTNNYFIAEISRRNTIRAIQHGFAVNALKIDGIDPLGDPQAIYDGSYAFSRKIHLVASMNNLSPTTKSFIRRMLSPEGQAMLAQLEFLPLQ
jgi:hypothetical protein